MYGAHTDARHRARDQVASRGQMKKVVHRLIQIGRARLIYDARRLTLIIARYIGIIGGY